MATKKDVRVKARLNVLLTLLRNKGDSDQRPGRYGSQRKTIIDVPEIEIDSDELETRLEHAQLVLEHGYKVVTTSIPPFVTTDDATDIGVTTGIFRGHVNPNGQSTAVRFEYSYDKPDVDGWVTCDETPVTGITNQSVHKDMTFMGMGGRTVFYRVRGVSSIATVYGNIKSFTLLPTPV